MAQGMFDYLGINPQLEDDYRFAQLTPGQRMEMEQRQAQRTATKGAENMLRAAVGAPPSPGQNREAAAAEVQALAKQVTPGTPEFYKQAADIFRKHGLVAEAEIMTQRLHDVELGRGEAQIVMQLQRIRDQLQKRLDAGDESVKPALAAIDRKLASYGESTTQKADPEFVRLMDAWSKETDPTRKEMLKKAIDAWIASKERAGQSDLVQWARLKLAEQTEARHEKKEERKAAADEAAIAGALQGTVRALDVELQAAQRLLEHSGLGRITGNVYGAMPLRAIGATSGGAAALYMTLEGQLFIRALQDLKATSKTGASGLGQLTEREGDKIQAAKAALDRQQPTDQFKRTLTSYIQALVAGRKVAEGELRKAGAEVPIAPVPVSDRPSVQDLAPGATPAPAPAPAAPKKRTFKATKVS